MIQEFLEFEEFDSWKATVSSIKQMVFSKKVKNIEYILEVQEGAFSSPAIYLKTDWKQLKRIEQNEAPLEIKKINRKIIEIMNRSNDEYRDIFPGVVCKFEDNKIEITNMIEEIDNFKDLSQVPKEIYIWAILETNEKQKEIKITLKNTLIKNKMIYWKVKNYSGFTTEKEEEILKKYVENLCKKLNKKSRILNLFYHFKEVK